MDPTTTAELARTTGNVILNPVAFHTMMDTWAQTLEENEYIIRTLRLVTDGMWEIVDNYWSSYHSPFAL